MIRGYYERISAFVSDYLQTVDGSPIPPDPRYIVAALKMLIKMGLPKEEIKRRAVRDYDVIIREDLFGEE